MEIAHPKQHPGVLVVKAGEEINEFGSDALNLAVDAAIAEKRDSIRVVVVDCSALEFLGSAGIGNLLHLQKHLAARGEVGSVVMRLAGLDADQAQVLRVTRVHTMIEIFPDLESAMSD